MDSRAENQGREAEGSPSVATHPVPQALRSPSSIQVELRRLFQMAPPNVALRQALGRIGNYFDAAYASLHGYVADTPLSEEWCNEGFEVGEALRERVTETMFGVLGGSSSRCLRLNVRSNTTPDGASVMVAPMFDEELQVNGAASIIVPNANREAAISILGQFEGLVGFLALLASTENELKLRMETSAKEALQPAQLAAAAAAHASADNGEDPWRVGWELVAHVQQRHGLDQVSLGIVTRKGNRNRITMRLVSGMSVVRAGNPGVQRIRAAMEEAIDRDGPTLSAGRYRATADLDEFSPNDPRLHRQWSEASRGDPVATVVLRVDEDAVAVVGLRHNRIDKLRLANLTAIEAELQPWGALIPLVELASRSVLGHARDALEHRSSRIAGAGVSRFLISLAVLAAIVCMFAFVEVRDSLNARATLIVANERTVSTPQSAVLTMVHARPGEHVREGQLLAEFDLRSLELEASELEARCSVLAVEVEAARAKADYGAVRASQARRDATLRELASVQAHLEHSEIRAPVAGTVLDGDLQSRIGDHLAIGEPLFTIAVDDKVSVEIRVPDEELPDETRMANAKLVFFPFANPDVEVDLDSCVVPPAATVDKGSAVFVLVAAAQPAPGTHLRPGMEGSVRIEMGKVSMWTATTRPIIHWLRRHLWL